MGHCLEILNHCTFEFVLRKWSQMGQRHVLGAQGLYDPAFSHLPLPGTCPQPRIPLLPPCTQAEASVQTHEEWDLAVGGTWVLVKTCAVPRISSGPREDNIE